MRDDDLKEFEDGIIQRLKSVADIQPEIRRQLRQTQISTITLLSTILVLIVASIIWVVSQVTHGDVLDKVEHLHEMMEGISSEVDAHDSSIRKILEAKRASHPSGSLP
jgi:Mn2+/Fe2+ NRAMP family transporter